MIMFRKLLLGISAFSLILLISYLGIKFINSRFDIFQSATPVFPNGIANGRWYGYKVLEFKFDGVDAKIVLPNKPKKQKYWIWRTQFWNLSPQVDTGLLALGYYVVFVDVADLYGNSVARARFNKFYKYLHTKFHLNKKVVLEGLSRGGLDAYNWAAENPEKVSCIYADAPVCDIKSWPGGLGNGNGSRSDWRKCLKAYDVNETTVGNLRNLPIYTCIKLAKAKVPVMHLCGDKDKVVPCLENTFILAKTYRKAGGEIQIIVKKGIGHQPHGLDNPKPIIDFILKNSNS